MITPKAQLKRSDLRDPPAHPAVPFRDPDESKHGWAAALRPSFTRAALPCTRLSERLIKFINDFDASKFTTDGKHKLCIMGSSVVQRILGSRYTNDQGLPDRELYPVEDIDVRLIDDQTLEELVDKLWETFGSRYTPSETGVHSYITGLHIYPFMLFEKGEKPDKTRFRAKVDLIAPLNVTTTDKPSPPNAKPNQQVTTIEKEQKSAAKVVAKATLQTMAVVDGVTVQAPTLSDMEYLNTLDTILEKEKRNPDSMEQKAASKQGCGEKARTLILPMLLYMEATRKIMAADWQPDPFNRKLLSICRRYIPEQFIKLHTLLQEMTDPQAARRLATFERDSGLWKALKKQKPSLPLTRDTRPPEKPPSPETRVKNQYRTANELSPGELERLIQLLTQEPEHEKRLVILFDEGVACEGLENLLPDKPELAELWMLVREPMSRPEPMRSSPRKGSETQQDWAVTEKTEEEPTTLNELPAKPEKKKTAKPETVRLSKSLRSYLQELQNERLIDGHCDSSHILPFSGKQSATGHTRSALDNTLKELCVRQYQDKTIYKSPVLSLSKEATHRHSAIKNLTTRGCPHTSYLRGTLLANTGKITDERNAPQHLVCAARAGVTGAALELLRLSLRRPELMVPTTVAMHLLRKCLRKPDPFTLKVETTIRQPIPAEERIIVILMTNLATIPAQPDDWVNAGQELLALSELLDAKGKERCLLIATCAMKYGGDTHKAKECCAKVDSAVLTSLQPHQIFDWDRQGHPDTASIRDLQNWLPMQALHSLKKKNKDSFLKILTTLDAGSWIDWLPFCQDQPMDLWCCDESPELQKIWQPSPTLKAKKKIAAPKYDPDTERPLHTLSAANLMPELKAPDKAQHLAAEWQEQDTRLIQYLQALSQNTQPPTADSSIDKGIRLTAEALHILNAKVDATRIVLPPTGETVTALPILREAIENHANPYACWLYARLQRPVLLDRLPMPQGEQSWYNHYLKFLLFAATMGVDGAANDLLGELIEGRADGLMIAIAGLISRRYRRSCNLKLIFEPAPTFQGKLFEQVKSWIGQPDNKDWCLHICKAMQYLGEYKVKNSDPVHDLRLRWLELLLFKFQRYPDQPVAEFVIPIYMKKLDIPMSLQATLLASMEYIENRSIPSYSEKMHKHLCPTALAFIEDWSHFTAACLPELELESTQEGETLLSYLQWQPATPTIATITDYMQSQLIDKGHLPIAPEVQQLLRFYQCTMLMDLELPLPAWHEKSMSFLWPWLIFYNTLNPAKLAALIKPSEQLLQQARIASSTDERLVLQLILNKFRKARTNTFTFILGTLLEKTPEQNANTVHLSKLTPETARDTRTQLFNLSKTDTQAPYIDLMHALCLEVESGSDTDNADITAAATQHIVAALSGVDDCASHLARLAFQYPNAPISMERVLDIYLLQRQRARRHRLHFRVPAQVGCSSTLRKIVATMDRLCLQDNTFLTEANREEELASFLEQKLIPALEEQFKTTKKAETRARLNLLISFCYERAGKNQALALLPTTDLYRLSHSILHQWASHLETNPSGNIFLCAAIAAATFNIQIACAKKGSDLRSTPYIIDQSKPEFALSKQFTDWYERPNSWYELLVWMGQKELHRWQRKLPRAVELKTSDSKTAPTLSCQLPGRHANAEYRLRVYQLIINCHFTGLPLRLPAPKNKQELAIARYWYEQYYMEVHLLTQRHPILHAATIATVEKSLPASVQTTKETQKN